MVKRVKGPPADWPAPPPRIEAASPKPMRDMPPEYLARYKRLAREAGRQERHIGRRKQRTERRKQKWQTTTAT